VKVSDALNQAQELLEQAQLNGEMAEVRHNALREAFEQRECDLESYLSALRDWLVSQAEVTVPQDMSDIWVSALNSNAKTRAQVFREISERPEVSSKHLHEAQVVSAYYGFFMKNPDRAYLNYLQKLDSGKINLKDLANTFINAPEYRQRFGN
jgi:hypothetical protein